MNDCPACGVEYDDKFEDGTERFDEVVQYARTEHNPDCSYGCGRTAEFVVTGRRNQQTVTWPACKKCCNDNGIWPIANGRVPERDSQ